MFLFSFSNSSIANKSKCYSFFKYQITQVFLVFKYRITPNVSLSKFFGKQVSPKCFFSIVEVIGLIVLKRVEYSQLYKMILHVISSLLSHRIKLKGKQIRKVNRKQNIGSVIVRNDSIVKNRNVVVAVRSRKPVDGRTVV